MIYDIVAHLSNKEGNVDKRVLVEYRNDKTFTVEQELKGKQIIFELILFIFI